MMPSVHDSLMHSFMQDSFKLDMNYVSHSTSIQSRELQMSTQPVQSTPHGPAPQQPFQQYQQVQRPQQQQQYMQQPSSSQFAAGSSTTPSPSPQQVIRSGGSSDPVSWATPGPSSSQRVMPRQFTTDSGNTSGISNLPFFQDLSFGGVSGPVGSLTSPWT